jgi:nucleoside-diphosphate-sugar epimerase
VKLLTEPMNKILVTGGTGLIGSHLIELLLEEGYSPGDIHVLVRPSSDTRFLTGAGVQLYYGDVLEADSLKAAMSDVGIIFHCAGLVGNRGQRTAGEMRQANWQINFSGTEHLLEAARWAGVEKFIHVSTVGIYGLPGEYVVSKRAAEEKVWEYHRSYGLKASIIRPALTLGERDRLLTKRLMALTRRKAIPLINGGTPRLPFVHAQDVARALILSSRTDQAVGQAYDVAGFSAPVKEVIQFFIERLGSHARIINVPSGAAYLGALVAEVGLAIARRSLRPIRSGHLRRLARLLATGLTLDTSRLHNELRFQPCYGMEETCERAIRWQLAREGEV